MRRQGQVEKQRTHPLENIRIALGLVVLLMAGPLFAGEAGSPFPIGTGLYPSLDTDSTGHVIVIWQRPQGGLSGQLYTPDGTPATDELEISADPDDGRPDVGWLSTGELVVAWERLQGNLKSGDTDVILEVMRRPIGTGLRTLKSSPIQIPNAARPAVGSDDQGRIAVAWVGVKPNSGADAGVYHFLTGIPADDEGAVADKRRPIGTGRLLGTAGPATPPELAMRGDGKILVVWESASKDIHGHFTDFDSLLEDADAVLAKRRPIGTGRLNESTSGAQSDPAVSVTLDGNFTVVWERTLPSGERHVMARRFTPDGVALTGDVRVSTEASTNAMAPSVAGDSVGNTIVTWHGADDRVTARSLTLEGVAVGHDFRVDPQGSAQGRARVTPAANGADFLVIWEEDDTRRILGSFLVGPFDLR